MTERADLLSPAFMGGLAGMAISGTAAGFVVGGAIVWLLLLMLIYFAALASEKRQRADLADLIDRAVDARITRRGTAATQ